MCCARLRASFTIASLPSTPITLPCGPTCSLRTRASVPVPHPRSKISSPDLGLRALRIISRLHAREAAGPLCPSSRYTSADRTSGRPTCTNRFLIRLSFHRSSDCCLYHSRAPGTPPEPFASFPTTSVHCSTSANKRMPCPVIDTDGVAFRLEVSKPSVNEL